MDRTSETWFAWILVFSGSARSMFEKYMCVSVLILFVAIFVVFLFVFLSTIWFLSHFLYVSAHSFVFFILLCFHFIVFIYLRHLYILFCSHLLCLYYSSSLSSLSSFYVFVRPFYLFLCLILGLPIWFHCIHSCRPMPIHATPSRAMSIHADPCRSKPIDANPRQSMLIHASPCQSMSIDANLSIFIPSVPLLFFISSIHTCITMLFRDFRRCHPIHGHVSSLTHYLQTRLCQILFKAIGFVFAASVMLMYRRVGGEVKRNRMKRSRRSCDLTLPYLTLP